MGVEAKTYGAAGKTRGEIGHQAVGPFLSEVATLGARFVGIARTIAQRAVFIVAAVVDATVKQAPLAVLDKAFGIVLL